MTDNISENNEEEYIEYLTGKRVCLVGPSSHIMNLNQRDLIESYDVVVRLNKSWPVPEFLWESSGSRTDVLYTGMQVHCMPNKSLTKTREFKDSVKFLVASHGDKLPYSNDILKFKKNNVYNVSFTAFELKKFGEMQRLMGTLPNTGCAALVHLLLYPLKELYITGMDFLRSNYVKGYRGGSKPNALGHNQNLQIKYIQNHCWEDPRITADTVFSEIMNSPIIQEIKKKRTPEIQKVKKKERLPYKKKIEGLVKKKMASFKKVEQVLDFKEEEQGPSFYIPNSANRPRRFARKREDG